ncbi:hypothetical protein CRI93_04310 [Longimonas halophila]|uniref:Uncharacterized protein n=2 Tax=Longimonas halophila TaxID=1469170 RepID=A0A2H3NN51_9BACT|nr:hypothetical protein CRI93_04310 [Longimonas halophila]
MNGASAPFETDSILYALPESLRTPVQTLIAQVEAATRQIQALQAENERLRDRIKTLEKRRDVPPSAFVLSLDENDPDALDDELSAHIETIDALLDDLPTPHPPADDASSSA